MGKFTHTHLIEISEENHLADLKIDGRIISKRILMKHGDRMRHSFFWDVTQSTFIVTEVSGQSIGSIFKG